MKYASIHRFSAAVAQRTSLLVILRAIWKARVRRDWCVGRHDFGHACPAGCVLVRRFRVRMDAACTSLRLNCQRTYRTHARGASWRARTVVGPGTAIKMLQVGCPTGHSACQLLLYSLTSAVQAMRPCAQSALQSAQLGVGGRCERAMWRWVVLLVRPVCVPNESIRIRCQAHAQLDCPRVTVPCTLKCGAIVQLWRVRAHARDECPNR